MKHVNQYGLDAAISELERKSYAEIEAETAIKWACRAIVARFLHKPKDSANYESESREHAAMVSPAFLAEIISDIDAMLKE